MKLLQALAIAVSGIALGISANYLATVWLGIEQAQERDYPSYRVR